MEKKIGIAANGMIYVDGVDVTESAIECVAQSLVHREIDVTVKDKVSGKTYTLSVVEDD